MSYVWVTVCVTLRSVTHTGLSQYSRTFLGSADLWDPHCWYTSPNFINLWWLCILLCHHICWWLCGPLVQAARPSWDCPRLAPTGFTAPGVPLAGRRMWQGFQSWHLARHSAGPAKPEIVPGPRPDSSGCWLVHQREAVA